MHSPFEAYRILPACFAITVLAYAVALPPFEVRDEPAHFAKAAQLASGAFPAVREDGQPGAMLPAPLVQVIRDWPPDGPNQATTCRAPSRIPAGLTAHGGSGSETAFAGFAYLNVYPPVLYVPQAAGLELGRLVGLAPLGQFYAGRLVAGAVAIAMVLLAVALLPLGRRAMLVAAALPGVSSQLASFSADSTIFALTFLTVAVLLRAQVVPVSRARWAMPVLLPLVALAKGVYLPIAAAGLGERAAWRPRRLAWTAASAVLGAALFAVWFGLLAGGTDIQHYVSRRTLQHVVAATPGEQLGFIAAHPGAAAWAVLSTIVERLPVYAVDGIGRFGWFNVLLPWPLYALGALVLAGSTVARPGERLPTAWQRALWLGIAGTVVLLVHMALYLTATALGETYVEGVQARYFVPVLPLILLALQVRPPPRLGRIVDAVLPAGTLLLMFGGLVRAATAFWCW